MKAREAEGQKITVIYVVGHLRTCGPSVQLLYLISNLDQERFAPVVLVTSASIDPTPIEQILKEEGAEIVKISAGKARSIITAPKALKEIADQREVFVVHPYGFRSDMICWLSRVKPRLGNVQNNLRHNYQRMFGNFLGSLMSFINLFFLKRTELVISCGQAVRRNLLALGQESIAIRNAIDSRLYRRLMCEGSNHRRQRRAPAKYLTISSNIPGKNIEFLVEQFAAMPTGLRQLTIIGPADLQLAKRYAEHENLDFRGLVSNPGDMMIETDYFISASEHEGIPNAVLEAFAMGRPVALSAIPAHLEIMEAVGKGVGTTFVCEEDSLTSALALLEEQDYEHLAKSSLEAVSKHFDPKQMAQCYQAVYQAVAFGKNEDIRAQLETLGRHQSDLIVEELED